MVLAAREEGKRVVCVPKENANEAQVVNEVTILPGESLNQVIELVKQFHAGTWHSAKSSDPQHDQKAGHAAPVLSRKDYDFAQFRLPPVLPD